MFCAQCGNESADDAKFCRSCGTSISSESHTSTSTIANNSISNDPVTTAQYADFWRRGAAAIIDLQILGAAGAAVGRLLGTKSDDAQLFGAVVFILLVALHFALLESRDSSTIGKRLLYLSVLRPDGRKLSFARALGRFFGRGISAILLGGGYLMQPFTAKKQALHDMIVDSVVVANRKGREWLVIAAWVFQILLLIAAIAMGGRLYSDGAQAGEILTESDISQLAAASASDLEPYGELARMFSVESDFTDLQRENMVRKIRGQIVGWALQVYEVTKEGDQYVVVTGADGVAEAIVYVTPRNAQDEATMNSLKTGSFIAIKGIISGAVVRSLVIRPAILIEPGNGVSTERVSSPSQLPSAEELARSSIRINPMKGRQYLDVEGGNVTGSCGNSIIRVLGITKAFNNVFMADYDGGRVIIRTDLENELTVNVRDSGALSDFNGIACVPTRSGERLLVWSQCSGSLCGEDFNFNVIDIKNLTYLSPKNELCDAQCASEILGSDLPRELN